MTFAAAALSERAIDSSWKPIRLAAALCALCGILAGVANASTADNYRILKRFDTRGSRVLAFNVTKPGPLALILNTAPNDGNVAAWISGASGRELLVNTIGAYAGITLYPLAKPGRYKLAIEAPDRWRGSVDLVIPDPTARSLIGRFKFHGDFFYQVRALRGIEPTVTATCRCSSNFVVWLRDYRGGADLLFNELGGFHGQTLAQPVPAGDYLLQIEADGPWTVTFAR